MENQDALSLHHDFQPALLEILFLFSDGANPKLLVPLHPVTLVTDNKIPLKQFFVLDSVR